MQACSWDRRSESDVAEFIKNVLSLKRGRRCGKHGMAAWGVSGVAVVHPGEDLTQKGKLTPRFIGVSTSCPTMKISRQNLAAKKLISRQQPHLAAKSLFSPQNVRDSSTAHTAVNGYEETHPTRPCTQGTAQKHSRNKGERTKQLRAQQHDSAFMVRTQRSSKLQLQGVHRHQGAVAGFSAHSCTPQTERRLSQSRSYSKA